jgi:hypothetical protein
VGIFETRLFKEDIPAIVNSLAEIAGPLGRPDAHLHDQADNPQSNQGVKSNSPAALGPTPWESELKPPETGDN